MSKIQIYVVRANTTVVNYPDCGGTCILEHLLWVNAFSLLINVYLT